MARKLPGLQPIFSATSLALVGYGEIGSSLFFALGVVAAYALGFTPWVLAIVGAILVIVSLSYAEGTTSTPEPGGAATFVRRAFNDPAGFATGWVLFLDYVVVIALAALFVPHYLGNALGWERITDSPWDVVVGIGVMAVIAAVRLVRRVRLIPLVVVVAAVTIVVQLVVFVLGMIYLFSTDALRQGLDLGVAPTADNFLFALSVAALAYTGIETVANLAAEAREPARTLPRSLIGGIALSAVMSVAIAVVGMCAYPATPDPQDPSGWSSALGTDWLRRSGLRNQRRPRRVAARPCGRCSSRLRRCHRRARSHRRHRHRDRRCRSARLLTRAAKHASARIRSARHSRSRGLSGHDRRRSDRGRAPRACRSVRRRREVPREPLQLRDLHRLHGCAACCDRAPVHRARSPPTLSRTAQRANGADRRSSPSRPRCDSHLRPPDHHAGDARRSPDRRAGLARSLVRSSTSCRGAPAARRCSGTSRRRSEISSPRTPRAPTSGSSFH